MHALARLIAGFVIAAAVCAAMTLCIFGALILADLQRTQRDQVNAVNVLIRQQSAINQCLYEHGWITEGYTPAVAQPSPAGESPP